MPRQLLVDVPNAFYHEWGLLAGLGTLVLVLGQVAYVLLNKRERQVTAQYLRIREVLAEIFRRALLGEVRAVFHVIEEHLPDSLIGTGPEAEKKSRFSLLAEGLREVDEGDADAQDLQRILRDSLAGILIGRVDALIAEAEKDADAADPVDGTRLHVSFAESTVNDFVYLAQALGLTRQRQSRFASGRKWALRSMAVLIPSYLFLLISMLFDHRIAYWVGTALIVVIGASGVIACFASTAAITAQKWLEEKADAPDPTTLLRDEVSGR